MPNDKYVTGVGKAHIRVTDIHIKVHAPGKATDDYPVCTVTFHEAESTVMADGSVREFSGLPAVRMDLRKSDMAQVLPIVHPDTDVNIGQTTMMAVNAHILAAVRHRQRQRDQAEEVAAAPIPSPPPGE